MTRQEEAASSMPAAPVGAATIEIDLGENCLGDGDWQATIEAAAVAGLKNGLSGPLPPSELYIALVDNERSHDLNSEYRGKDKATNILSFPGTDPDELPAALKFSATGGPPVMLGDLIIADAVVAIEASQQGKSVFAHLSHLVVHGVLHLLGHDHISAGDAREMEDLERDILATLGINDPYETVEE